MLCRIMLGVTLGAAALSAGCAHRQPEPAGGHIAIAPDKMLVVDGQRTFVLGLYENPKEDAVLKDVADAGFNLVQSAAEQAALDRLADAGLFAWVNTGSRIDLSIDETARQEQLRQLVDTCGSHPALLVWEVPDEALWNCWYIPFCWRNDGEPTQLQERIDALEDEALAASLTADLAKARDLREQGKYAEAEAVANATWRALGAEPKTGPRFDLSTSAETAAKMCDGMVAGYHVMKELDPAHPIWMNHAPRNQLKQLAAFAEGADIVGCDIYPVPQYRMGHSDLADRSLSSVGAYTDIMQRSAPGKPVWMVLQGFGWTDINVSNVQDGKEVNRRPNAQELRFMAYDTVVHGARAILYWGTAYVEKDSELWQDLLQLVRELADLQDVLSAPDADLNPAVTHEDTMSSFDVGVRVLPKQVGDQAWLIVVNENEWPVTCTISNLDGAGATSYRDTVDGEVYAVADGALTMTIRGHGVRVLDPTTPSSP